MDNPGHPKPEPSQEAQENISSNRGNSRADASEIPETAVMNDCIVGASTDQLTPIITHQEDVELAQKVKAALMLQPVREDLVEEARAQIRSGVEPSSLAIAEAILSHRMDERSKGG